MLPRLTNGFCGCTLHTSSLVLSWIQVFSSGLIALSFAVAGPITIKNLVEKEMEKGHQIDEGVFVAAFAIVLVIFTVGLMINVFLLYGVYKKNHCMMMPYLILAASSLSLNIIADIIMFFNIFIEPSSFGTFFFSTLYTAVSGYFWLIVYSYYQQIKDQAPYSDI